MSASYRLYNSVTTIKSDTTRANDEIIDDSSEEEEK